MKRLLLIICMAAVAAGMTAQPAARRQAEAAKASRTNANNTTTRAQISFPTQARMEEDVVWRRDLYRQLRLEEDANAGLYYPVEPTADGRMNLFTCIFKLMMRGQVHVYSYTMDGNENFSDSMRLKPKDFLDKYHIYYERTDRGVKIDNSDIPSSEVKSYYIKESAYYDQRSATFHRKVTALCPIMYEIDDFGGIEQRPLFWVRYDDLAPFLTKQTIMTSNLNNAATMSIDDYFTMNKYNGKIYKTANMLGRTLDEIGNGDTARVNVEQRKIEAEMAAFEKSVWGDHARRDSLDSIATAAKPQKAARKTRQTASTKPATQVKPKRSSSAGQSSGGSSAPRVSVRRQRH